VGLKARKRRASSGITTEGETIDDNRSTTTNNKYRNNCPREEGRKLLREIPSLQIPGKPPTFLRNQTGNFGKTVTFPGWNLFLDWARGRKIVQEKLGSGERGLSVGLGNLKGDDWIQTLY